MDEKGGDEEIWEAAVEVINMGPGHDRVRGKTEDTCKDAWRGLAAPPGLGLSASQTTAGAGPPMLGGGGRGTDQGGSNNNAAAVLGVCQLGLLLPPVRVP